MYNEIFANYDVTMFNSFVEKVKKEQCLKSKVEDLVDLIIESLKEEAKKKKKNNVAAFGIDDNTLTKAIIKADSCMAQYLKSKNKKPKDETPKTKVTKTTKVEKKETKGAKFDLTQLELFDFE